MSEYLPVIYAGAAVAIAALLKLEGAQKVDGANTSERWWWERKHAGPTDTM